ncbi:MAG: CsbD family protein [Geodermatophilaceae bacterium]|nr:CsbD family protein [Geodermatophilaceae bacterium]
MSAADKIKNKAEEMLGKGKETTGEATNDDSMAQEGRNEQSKSDMKQAGENVKDAFKHNS